MKYHWSICPNFCFARRMGCEWNQEYLIGLSTSGGEYLIKTDSKRIILTRFSTKGVRISLYWMATSVVSTKKSTQDDQVSTYLWVIINESLIFNPFPMFWPDTTKDATDSRKFDSLISNSFRTCDGNNGFRCMRALEALISAAEAVKPIWSDSVMSDDVIVSSDDVIFFFGKRLKHLLAASISPLEMKYRNDSGTKKKKMKGHGAIIIKE